MTIRVNNIVLSLDDDISILKKKVSKKLKISIDEIKNFKIIKESLDARNKDNILKICDLFDMNQMFRKEMKSLIIGL